MVSFTERDPDLRPMRRRRRAARATITLLPTLLTLSNLLSGAAAIFIASRPTGEPLPFEWTNLTWAASFIFLGMVFDGLDGRIARMTHNTSDLGEQLDSMADMVTFGMAPAFIAVQLALTDVGLPYLGSLQADNIFNRTALVVGAIYVACTALRLARFNIELGRPIESDHMSFKGLPSPGAAGTVASVVLLHQHILADTDPDHWTITASAVVMVAIMLLAAVGMVSRLRYAHLMNRYFRGQAKFATVVRVVVLLLLLAIHPQLALAGAFCIYALSAPSVWAWRRGVRRGGR